MKLGLIIPCSLFAAERAANFTPILFVDYLLLDNSRHVLHVIYKYLPPTPIPMEQMPKIPQFKIEYDALSGYMGWEMFIQNFVQVSELLLESNLHATSSVFSDLVKFLPQNIYFYLKATSPNEWHCFLRSLCLLHSIQLIHFDTKDVTPTQFCSTHRTEFVFSHILSCAVRIQEGYFYTISVH